MPVTVRHNRKALQIQGFSVAGHKPDSVGGDHLSRPPVARRLERRTRPLGGPPRRGLASPCTGRGLASRRVTTTLVGSYPTVSPLPPASPEMKLAGGGLLSVPLSVG